MIRLTAQNNSIMADVLTQLKLLDRSDIAWQDGEYDALWNGESGKILCIVVL